MLSVPEAAARIVAAVAPLPVEEIALSEAVGCVLAADAVSPVTLPRWDNSAMDGYAVHGADVDGASETTPRELPVVGSIAAGAPLPSTLQRGEAMQIMTGAFMPPGADTVVRVEDTDGGVHEVVVHDARDAGRNVRPSGEDARLGEVLLRPGATLGPAQLGVLASAGAARPLVFRRPRVAVLATGDELVEAEEVARLAPGDPRIANSNAHALAALVREAGGIPMRLGIARDEPAAVREAVERAATCDVLVTSGGVSAGAFDHLRATLAAMGATLVVERVRMRPGAPLAAGRMGALRWLGLPGNPVSTLVTFTLFGAPLVRALGGHALPFPRPVAVRLAEPVTIAAPLEHFLRVTLEPAGADGLPLARLTGAQGSGLLTSMARADALLVVPADRPLVEAGARLSALVVGPGAGFAARFATDA